MNGTGRIIFKSANHPDFDPKPADEEPVELPPATSIIPPPKVRSLGLGDWVESWAKPVGCAIDRATRELGATWFTGLCGCSACSRRRLWLNALVPNCRRWKGGWKVACKRIAAAVQHVLWRV
jgi:hypothetical protein